MGHTLSKLASLCPCGKDDSPYSELRDHLDRTLQSVCFCFLSALSWLFFFNQDCSRQTTRSSREIAKIWAHGATMMRYLHLMMKMKRSHTQRALWTLFWRRLKQRAPTNQIFLLMKRNNRPSMKLTKMRMVCSTLVIIHPFSTSNLSHSPKKT